VRVYICKHMSVCAQGPLCSEIDLSFFPWCKTPMVGLGKLTEVKLRVDLRFGFTTEDESTTTEAKSDALQGCRRRTQKRIEKR